MITKSKLLSFFKTYHLSLITYHFKSGQLIIVSLIFLTIVMILAASLFGRTARFLRFGGNSLRNDQATNLAEAGVDYALWKLNETGGSYTGEPDIAVGTTGVFTVQIQEKSPPNPQLKTIIVTGFVPDSTNPRAKRTIKLDTSIDSTTIEFRYAVQVGDGGVDMENDSRITGPAGTSATVYTNGSVTCEEHCGPPGPRINGDAYAVGTVSNPPCAPPPDAIPCQEFESQPTELLPTINYDNWRTAAASEGEIKCADTPLLCNITNNADIGPKKYIGDLTITNDAFVTVKGAIWVYDGNFTVEGGLTKVKLDDSFDSNGTVIIIDPGLSGSNGKVKVTNGAKFLATNATPKGYIVVTTTSTAEPADLANCNSTPAPAMLICNAGDEAVFYSLVGKAELLQSADVTALVAKTLSMRNNAILTYDTGLASAQFSSGPGGSWQVKKGTYRFTNSP